MIASCVILRCRVSVTFLQLLYLLYVKGDDNDFHFTVEPVNTVVIKGNSATLDCAASGDPSPVIRWKQEGGDWVLPDDRRRILDNGSLYFEHLYHHTRTGRPDEDVYQCVAEREGFGAIISQTAKLQIASLPKFDVHPANLTVSVGQTAYFSCLIQAVPKIAISWLKDDRPLKLDDLHMTLLPSGALEISLVKRSDVGSYKCNASNVDKFRISDAGKLSIDHESNPNSAPHFIAAPPKTTTVLEGEPLTLDCVAVGNPLPRISWLKDGTTIDLDHLDSRFHIVGTGSLFLEKSTEDDAGTYTCRADNNVDSIDSLVNVIVHVPPRFVKQPLNKFAYEKEDIEMECEAYGKPPPMVTWKKDGMSLASSEFYQYIKGTNLRILGVMKHDAGMYQCFAANPSGNIQSSLQLLVKTPDTNTLPPAISSASASLLYGQNLGPYSAKDTPSSPLNLTAMIVATRFVALKWNPPEITNGEVFAYSVYYHELASKRERVINSTKNSLEEINIQGLLPSTSYVFRVVAYNKHGPGQTSENLTVTTNNEAKVPTLPSKLEALVINATSAAIRWQPPSEDSEPIQKYTVHYLEEGSDEEQETSTSDTLYILNDLKKFTEYTVWVTATSLQGVGQSTREITFKTYSDVPSEPPQNCTVEPASSNSVVIRWEPPPKESQNGIITGYKIRYKLKGKRADTVTTDGNRRMYVLAGLERGLQYSVKISALSTNGTGPSTDWIQAETFQIDLNESKVPEQPSALRVRSSSKAIYVNWDPPKNANIMVRGYQIGWGLGIPDKYTEVLDGKQRQFMIPDLKPSAEYVISLRASNEKGTGVPIYEAVKTLVESTPGPFSSMMPPVGLKAIVLSSKTVVLYWTDTTLSNNQIISDNRHYTVRYTSNNKNRFYNSTDLNCMIDDLKPNTQYEFAVKVVKGRRESTWSMSVLNTTQESVPSSPPRDLTTVPSEEDHNQINLHWQPPKQPNGQVIGYVISYSTVPPQKNLAVEDRKWVLQESIGDRMTSNLKNLQLDTTYYFKIQAKNKKGYGPFSSEISFRTPAGSKSVMNPKMFIIIGSVSGGALILLIVLVVIVCKCRRKFGASKRNKSYAKGSLSKNKAQTKELVPPDLWIHHDQMELKPVEKNVCAENNMTLTPIQRNSQELGDEPLLSCIEKKKSAYLDPLDSTSSLLNKCIVKCQIRATPLKIPLDVQKPLLSNASVVPLPSSSTSQICDLPGSSLNRPLYPRTQYNIPRTLNANEIGNTGSAVDVNVPLPLNVHVSATAFEPNVTVEKCQVFSPTAATSAGVAEHGYGGTLTKRPVIVGHPLRSFTVPAPPTQSAPTTPQPKHLDTCASKPPLLHSAAQPSVLQSQSVAQSSAKQAEGVPSVAAKSGAMDSAHVSWSTEKLNQEVANLEGLMKDLNAIRASEFEC